MRAAALFLLMMITLAGTAHAQCAYPEQYLERAATVLVTNVDVNNLALRVRASEGEVLTLFLNPLTQINTVNGRRLQIWDLQAGEKVTVVAFGIPENLYVLRILVHNGW